ncbi:hypothetical protein J5J86_20210 [Aquabacter sp. L1I39]|uniref:COG4223 family protein n=1 Tax=Aquabacter sp. L1I39 TaxID=2820278 RepID=UPI001ADBC3E4|nr:hypothetical protein [Aquabacter sp. L1I39]QTL03060.1 hypothetical protein J5J86_20210 [Aquabacter sp. L1I39]
MARNDRSRKDPTGTEPGPANADLPPEDRASRPAPEAVVDDPMPTEPDAILPEERAAMGASTPVDSATPVPPEGETPVSKTETKAAGEHSAEKAPSPPESALIPPPPPPHRGGPSPWIALPVGALAGALAAAAVAYGLNGRIAGGAESDLAARVVVLEGRPIVDPNALTSLSGRVAKLEAVPPVDIKAALSGIQGDVNALKQSQQTMLGAAKDSAAAAASVSQQATALAARIDAVQKKMEEVAATSAALDKSVATLAVLGSLREAILSGRPYAAELDAARAVLGQGAAALEPAASSAATGLPMPAELSRRLAEAAAAAGQQTAEASAAPASGSMVDRLLSSAESLVKLRSTETAAAPAAADRLSAAQAALRAGDLDKALEAINALPPDLKTKLAAVTAQITARRDAANAAATLYQQALAAISGKVP